MHAVHRENLDVTTAAVRDETGRYIGTVEIKADIAGTTYDTVYHCDNERAAEIDARADAESKIEFYVDRFYEEHGFTPPDGPRQTGNTNIPSP